MLVLTIDMQWPPRRRDDGDARCRPQQLRNHPVRHGQLFEIVQYQHRTPPVRYLGEERWESACLRWHVEHLADRRPHVGLSGDRRKGNEVDPVRQGVGQQSRHPDSKPGLP